MPGATSSLCSTWIKSGHDDREFWSPPFPIRHTLFAPFHPPFPTHAILLRTPAVGRRGERIAAGGRGCRSKACNVRGDGRRRRKAVIRNGRRSHPCLIRFRQPASPRVQRGCRGGHHLTGRSNPPPRSSRVSAWRGPFVIRFHSRGPRPAHPPNFIGQTSAEAPPGTKARVAATRSRP